MDGDLDLDLPVRAPLWLNTLFCTLQDTLDTSMFGHLCADGVVQIFLWYGLF